MASTWLIIGASSGIGRHMTEQLLRRGDRVAAALGDPSALDVLAERHGGRLWRAQLAATDHHRLRDVVDAAFATLGHIDVVVPRAGHGGPSTAEQMPDAQARRPVDLAAIAAVHLAGAVTEHLRDQGGGTVLQTSDVGGHIAFAATPLHRPGTWAMEHFFEAHAVGAGPFAVRTLVQPGMVQTDFFASADLAASDVGLPAGTAAAAFLQGPRAPLDAVPEDPRQVAAAMIRIGDLEPGSDG